MGNTREGVGGDIATKNWGQEKGERGRQEFGDSSEEMEEGNFFQILFLSLLEITVVASRTAYLCTQKSTE